MTVRRAAGGPDRRLPPAHDAPGPYHGSEPAKGTIMKKLILLALVGLLIAVVVKHMAEEA